jgi:hypothetical protein
MQATTKSELNDSSVPANTPAEPKRRKSVSPPECNAKNLAKQFRALLAKQAIEVVLQFYTSELVGMIEKYDPELRAIIRQAATNNTNIAEICRVIELEDARLASTH